MPGQPAETQGQPVISMMKINLLDPGLQGMHGHHLEWDLRVVEELRRCGHDVVVYANAGIGQDAAAAVAALSPLVRHFRFSPYAYPEQVDRVAGELILFLDGAALVAQDLRTVRDADMWMWPSLFSSQLYACSILGSTMPMSACVHVEPTFMASSGPVWWRFAFLRAQQARLRMNIGVAGPMLQKEYAPLTAVGHIGCFPAAHDGAPSGRAKTALRRIGFFGHQRHDKGVGMLPVLVPRLLQDRYEVVLHDSGNLVRADAMPGLTVLGYVPSLATEIARCDLVVVPYDPIAYRARESAIVWDAISSGVPVLVPAGTASSALVQSTGAGRTFPGGSAEHVYEAIKAAEREFDQIAAAALAACLKWRETRGVKHFVAAMLENAGSV